ncbi:MAG: PHP domain-containing protein [Candidatus Methylomirabilis sp.]|nr:PHP domain-containing protein [Deltaproteobacteria bacterium]
MRGVFHAHSTYSHDGRCTLPELVSLCTARGLGFIALSEHAEDMNAARMDAFTSECKELSKTGVILLPGLEFGFSEYPKLHLLGIGVTSYIPPSDISLTIGSIREQGGLAVLAHPARNGHFVPEDLKGKLDGIEVWNAAYDSRYLPHHRSIMLYRSLKEMNPSMLAFGGLDFHTARNFRELDTVVKGSPADAKELLNLLRNGSFTSKGRLCTIGSRQEFGYMTAGGIRLGRVLLEGADALASLARGNRWRKY